MRSGHTSALVAAALACAPLAAHAHGAYPISLNLFFPDPSSDALVLETNFGLISRDGSGVWRLMCEEAVSPGVKWFAMDETGRIGMGHAGGYASSTDGCNFQSSSGVHAAVRWVERIATGSNVAPTYFVLLDEYVAGRNLLRSRDGGATFERVTTPEGLLVNAVRGDLSMPGRVFVTAQRPDDRLYDLLVSDDFGETWKSRGLDDLPGIVRVFGVFPSGVFLRTTVPGSHAIWRGDTWDGAFENVLQMPDQPAFVADVGDDVVWASKGVDDEWRSTDGGRTWAPADIPGDATCLLRHRDTLYSCSTDRETNLAVAKSSDGGLTWETVLTFNEVESIVSCPDGSDVTRECVPLWPLLRLALRGEAPANQPPITGDGGNGGGGGWQCGVADVGALGLLALGCRRRGRQHAQR